MDFSILIVYHLLLGILGIYAIHRLHLVRLLNRVAIRRPSLPGLQRWPAVAVQLPLFNEANVAERLIEAAARLSWPGTLEIQVLDDSTDHTPAIVERTIARLRPLGVDIRHIRRQNRDGYKAGALQSGLTASSAEFFAVFDADFVPPPDFLLRTMAWFADQHVGMVQARWSHLNREVSLLTRIQAIYLDGHFAVESAARHLGGRFFNFNGTAGVWRREAIEAAGGWSASTLTEDLDLSYRAQLAGWRFVFLPDVAVPAELPATLGAFQDQQHRWAKGSIQTARKLLPRILLAPLPLPVKLEAIFHLTNNGAYLLTLLLGLLMVPAMLIRQRLGLLWMLGFDAAMFATSWYSLARFYLEGQRRVGVGRRNRDIVSVLPFGIGMSVQNAAAVIDGMANRGGVFLRTPKAGQGGGPPGERRPRFPLAETLLCAFFAIATAAFLLMRQFVSLPFLSLFLLGYGTVAAIGIGEWVAHAGAARGVGLSRTGRLAEVISGVHFMSRHR